MTPLIPQSLRITYLNLQRNRRRSLLSVLIIAIAIFALTASGGYGLYSYQSLQEFAARDTGHLTLSQPGYFEKSEEMPLENGLVEVDAITQALIQHPEVKGIQPRVEFTGLVSNGNKSTIFVGLGVNDREFDMKGPTLDLLSGKTLTGINSPRYDAGEPEVMLATSLARNLSVEVGDWVTLLATTSDGALNAYDFKIQGIYSTGVPEVDKRQLYVHIQSSQDLLATSKVSTLSLFLFDTGATQTLQSWVEEALAGLNLRQPIAVTPWQDLAFFYAKVKNLYDRIFGIMGGVMALVIFVAISNSMAMSVTERTQEIGTLSALGSYPSEIIASFVKEAGLLAIIGSMVGGALTALTSLLLLLVDVQMPPPPGRTQSYPLQIYFSLDLWLCTAFAVMVLCIFAAWISARKGVQRPITEALTYV